MFDSMSQFGSDLMFVHVMFTTIALRIPPGQPLERRRWHVALYVAGMWQLCAMPLGSFACCVDTFFAASPHTYLYNACAIPAGRRVWSEIRLV